MKEPTLYDTISAYKSKARFHMPSHGGERIDELYSAARFDITELSFSDNLASPNGIIEEAERNMALAVGSPYSLFFTCGATSAIFTALKVASHHVGEFILLGEVHASVINALELFNVPYKKAESVRGAKGGIVLTSPDYYGNTENVAEIRRDNPDALLIVDEAHGAHFAYSRLLPESALNHADLTIHGMHKTMPVYGGGALLHVRREDLYLEAREARRKLHSSSPSYLVMASMDYARALFEENGERYYKEIKAKLDSLVLPEGFSRVLNDDFSRLVIEVPAHTSGYAVAKKAEKNGIYFEMADSTRLTAIITPFNLKNLDSLKELTAPEKEKEELGFLLGEKAKNDLILYPPGRILIKKGDIIDKETLSIIESEKARILGLWI